MACSDHLAETKRTDMHNQPQHIAHHTTDRASYMHVFRSTSRKSSSRRPIPPYCLSASSLDASFYARSFSRQYYP